MEGASPRPTWCVISWCLTTSAGAEVGAPGRRALRKASPLAGEVPQCAHWGGRGKRPVCWNGSIYGCPPQSRFARQLPRKGGSQGRAHHVRPYKKVMPLSSPPHPALRATFPPVGGRLAVRPGGRPFVVASSISFASAWRRKLPHFAAPTLPTRPASLGSRGGPIYSLFRRTTVVRRGRRPRRPSLPDIAGPP